MFKVKQITEMKSTHVPSFKLSNIFLSVLLILVVISQLHLFAPVFVPSLDCPNPPVVEINEMRSKLSKTLWANLDPKTKILLVSAPRVIRPESDMDLPGYRQVSNILYILGDYFISNSVLILTSCPNSLCIHVYLPYIIFNLGNSQKEKRSSLARPLTWNR